MKPIELIIQAFGPYRDKVDLDFRDLESQKLFLITGPTGAGKTSILDAMVYALYGVTSSGLRDGASMRSDFADLSTMTFVEFTFSIGDSMYRMERSPKQVLKKKRGEGTKIQLASATLSIWNDKEEKWSILTSTAKDIAAKIDDIIGFRAEQFLQVVLLPQGEFRRLLVAPTSVRESLLHSLFKTEIYKRLENLLKEKYTSALEASKSFVERQRILLEQVGVESLIALEKKIKVLAEEESKVKQNFVEKDTVLHEADLLIKALKDYEDAEIALANAKKALDTLLVEKEKQEREEKELEILTAIQPLLWSYEVINSNKSTLKKLETKLGFLKKEMKDLVSQEKILQEIAKTLDLEKVKYEADKRTLNQLESDETGISKIRELEKLLADYPQRIKDSKETLDEQRNCVIKKDTIINDLELAKKELESWLFMHKDDSLKQERIKQEAKNLQDLEIEGLRLTRQKQDLLKEKTLLLELENKAKKSQRQVEIVTEALHIGQAFVLAANLEEGQPCAVCGSTHHPQLAVKPENIPTLEEVEICKGQAEVAERELVSKRSEIKVIENQYEKDQNLWKTVLEEKSLYSLENILARKEVLKVEIDHLTKLLEEGKAQEKQLKEIKYKIEEERKLLLANQEDLQRQEVSYQESLHEEEKLKNQLEQLIKVLQLPLHTDWESLQINIRKTIDDYENRVNSWKLDSTRVQKAISSNKTNIVNYGEQSSKLLEHIKLEEEKLNQDLVGLELSLDDLLGYQKNISKLEGLKLSVNQFNDNLARHQALYTSALEKLQGLTKPEITINEEDYHQIKADRDAALAEQVSYQEKMKALESSLTSLKEIEIANREQSKKLAFVTRLYDLARGGQAAMKGINFERYVLGAILDEVIFAANQRLKDMSRSRYHLERNSEATGNGAKGLDLNVFDSYTGIARPANTLSGGETFLASLALALGLADVIQSYAGGIHMETIFIDEGFGTLDTDALDIALETLVNLQENGRLIGVISHVSELKERIPAHLVIDRTRNGSSAKFVIA